MKTFTVGFAGFGEINSPRDLIEKKCRDAEAALRKLGATLVVTAPLCDDPAGRDAVRAIDELGRHRLDAIVLCVAGWIPSQTILRVAGEFRHLPILLWGLAGHFERDRLITTADQAGTTALRHVMETCGYRFAFVYNWPGRPPNISKVKEFLLAAEAEAFLRQAKVGSMGYRDMGLYTTLFDGIGLKRALGVEIECFEMLEMVQRAEKVPSEEIAAVTDNIIRKWKFQQKPNSAVLATGVGYYLALKAMIEERGFDAVTLIDVDGMKKLLGFPPAMVFMLLADEMKRPCVPENDCLGAVTQLLVRSLTGQAAAYFEFYEFMEDRLLLGVPDFVPSAVVDGEVRVLPTRFGSLSEGIVNVSKVKTGPVTLTRLVPVKDGYKIHAVTGTAVTPGPWEEAGWQRPAPQLPGLEVILDSSVEDFAEKVACQHYILSYGNLTGPLKTFCRMSGIALT